MIQTLLQQVKMPLQGTFFNDCHVLDLREWRWHGLVTVTTAPTPRYAHVSVTVDGRVILHGGANAAQAFNSIIHVTTDLGEELDWCASATATCCMTQKQVQCDK